MQRNWEQMKITHTQTRPQTYTHVHTHMHKTWYSNIRRLEWQGGRAPEYSGSFSTLPASLPDTWLILINWAWRPRQLRLRWFLHSSLPLLWPPWSVFQTCMLSHVWLFVTPRTVAHQAPLSMVCSRQEYWSWLPFLLQGIFPAQGPNACLLHWQEDYFTTASPGKPIFQTMKLQNQEGGLPNSHKCWPEREIKHYRTKPLWFRDFSIVAPSVTYPFEFNLETWSWFAPGLPLQPPASSVMGPNPNL